MTGDPVPSPPKTPVRRYFAGPAVGVACVLVVALVAWWRGCPPDPPRPGTIADDATVDFAASVPVEYGGRKGWLTRGRVVLEPARDADGDAGSRDE
jgi:hypothetical protein